MKLVKIFKTEEEAETFIKSFRPQNMDEGGWIGELFEHPEGKNKIGEKDIPIQDKINKFLEKMESETFNKMTGDIWNRMTPVKRNNLAVKAGLNFVEGDKKWIDFWPEQKRAIIRAYKKENMEIQKATFSMDAPKVKPGKMQEPLEAKGDEQNVVKGKNSE